MIDYKELKLLAEKCLKYWTEEYPDRKDYPDHYIDITRSDDYPEFEFYRNANPATVLALIAENERKDQLFEQSEKALGRVNAMWHRRWKEAIGSDYPIPTMSRDEQFDHLKAEAESLRAELEELAELKAYVTLPMRERCAQRKALEEEVELLRKDAERYRWLRDETNPADVEYFSHQNPLGFEMEVDAAMTKEQD